MLPRTVLAYLALMLAVPGTRADSVPDGKGKAISSKEEKGTHLIIRPCPAVRLLACGVARVA
jgi:hypothetical protein